MGARTVEQLRETIEREGPITFARFMEVALYGPEGYYEQPPVGTRGDFVTSPHVHPVFGELLAEGLQELREHLGGPEPFRVVEAGAGDGTLARQLLAALPDLDYRAVEVSAGARASLAEDGLPVDEELEVGGAHVVLAHELLDNLPFRVMRDGREVRIAWANSRLVEVLTEPGDELRAFAQGGDGVVPTGALAWIDRVAAGLAHAPAYVLLIDYGGVGEAGGPLHGYRSHGLVEDVLASPGDTDITSGVDFAVIAARAQERGLVAFPSATQHDVLMALGFDDWFRTQLGRQHEQLATGEGAAAVHTWGDKSRATLLADPAGLGRHRWLVLASGGLPAPSWLQVSPIARLTPAPREA